MTTRDGIPLRQPPELTPPICTLADLERHWRSLMGPLGFSGHTLWMLFLTADGRATPVVSQITDLPHLPDEELVDSLMHITDRVCRDIGDGSVAFLLSHPGSAGVAAADRTWAQQLTRAAKQAGVVMWPVHTADDSMLRPLTPDDLVESRGP